MKLVTKNPRAEVVRIKLKTNDPKERQLLEELRTNLINSEQSLWESGRIINELKKTYGYMTKELAHMFRQQRNRLDEIAATARAYPKGKRRPDVTFYGHEVARRVANRTSIGLRRHFDEDVPPLFDEALNVVAEQTTKGKHDVREGTKNLLQKARRQHEPKRLAHVAKLSKANASLLREMHHMDCRDLMPKIAKKSIKLVHLDVPYANYHKTKDGGLHKASASVAVDCDNDSRDSAVTATIDALKLAVGLLVPNGVICLWQAANGLQWKIGKAIEDCGLTVHPRLIWDKGHAQMGDPSMGIMYSVEDCYVLTRRGENPLCQHDGERGQIVRANRINQRADNYEVAHLMQKPREVNAELLNRFTQVGDTVLDAFGCSASMCAAAHSMGRKWIYSESNPKNFALGKRNMENHLLTTTSKVAA